MDMTSQNFWDNHRVPLNPYSIFRRIGIHEFENSLGLHFYKNIEWGTKKHC